MPAARALETIVAFSVYPMSSSDILPLFMECIDYATVTGTCLVEDGGVTSLSAGGIDWDVNFTAREGVLRSFTVIDTASGLFSRVSNAYQSPEYDDLCRLLTRQA